MATSSFNKTFVVTDKESVKYIREKLSQKRDVFNKPSRDYLEKRERGRKLLEQL